MTRWIFLACISTISFLAGCSDSTTVRPVAVSGTVELDGKPLDDGTITLVGEGGETPNTLEVKAGKFDGQATPGKKRVEIRAFKMGEATKMDDTIIEATKENYLPAEYNTDSKVTAEVGTSGGITPAKFEAKSN